MIFYVALDVARRGRVRLRGVPLADDGDYETLRDAVALGILEAKRRGAFSMR